MSAFNLAPIVDRLESQVRELRLVGGWDDYYREVEQTSNTPSAFVLPAEDTGGPNLHSVGSVQQRVTLTFAVVTCFSSLGDISETNNFTSFSSFINSVRKAIHGWVPPGAVDPLTFVSGAVVGLRNGAIWWQDSFQTSYIFRSTEL